MNKIIFQKILVIVFMMMFVIACGKNQNINDIPTDISSNIESINNSGEIQVIISGGYELDPRDNGRPVVLIASALGVPEEVFREAFSHVNPAGAGQEPSEEQVRANKAVLMNVLEPYGVTNEYLDEVSNYYRYNRSAGETWRQVPAIVEAIVENGVVTGFEIINAGSGYTSAPTITVTGSDVSATAVLSFTQDFETNGSIAEIVINP